MTDVIGLICARGGSKGLPGKNIRPLGGKPLIAWAIEQAFSVKRIKRVIVSTDSREIAEVAILYGAEVPFMRPDALALDNSPEWLVWRHSLEYLKEADGVFPEVLACIPVTAPLRSSIDIDNCLDEYFKEDIDAVVTITDAHRSPYFNMVKMDVDKNISLVIPPSDTVSRRQDAPVVYDMTTVAYIVRPDFVMTKNGLFEGNVRAVHVPAERAIDIDTMIDFKIAECLLNTVQA